MSTTYSESSSPSAKPTVTQLDFLPPLTFVVESGTDVRLVEGLAARFALTVLARKIDGGVEISQPTDARFHLKVGPASRVQFARFVFALLWASRHNASPVLVQGYALAALAVNFFSRMTGAPSWMIICSPIEAYYRCKKLHGAGYRFRDLLALGVVARANALLGRSYIVLSNHLKKRVQRHGTPHPIHTIPLYGVDTRLFAPAQSSRLEVRRSLGLPTQGYWIFFSSRIAPEKDSETLLRAVRQLIQEGRDIRILHRSGGYLNFLDDAERFGIAENVIASDAVAPGLDLVRSYQACDLCVQASREEGLGFSVLEALSCGIPVVAARVGGLMETIRDGETGYTYTVGDATALASAIARAMDSPAESRALAHAGRRMVEENFSARRAFDDFYRLANPKAASVRASAARS